MSHRILIFSTAYFPYVGGAEVALKEITDRLGECEFALITAKIDKKQPRTEKIGNVIVHRIGLGLPKFDKIFLAVYGGFYGWKLHRKNKFAAVWSSMASFSGFAALTFKQLTGVPFLLTLQEGDPIEYILKRVRFVRYWFNQIFIHADALQPISTYLLEWGKTMGFNGKIAEVVPNGVDIGRFTEIFAENEVSEIRFGFGFPKEATVVVTTSRLVVKNGIESVIRALPMLAEKVCFVICGIGELQNKLQNLVHELHLENRVRFLGNINHKELPKILKASDIFIRPSVTEGLGNSFLEAMAAGLPTIGTAVGGLPDFLIDGVTGFVCEPNNPKSVAGAIQRVLKISAEEKNKMHANAMRIILDKFNWEYITKRMQYIFNELCGF